MERKQRLIRSVVPDIQEGEPRRAHFRKGLLQLGGTACLKLLV